MMKPIQDMTQGELVAYVQSHHKEYGIEVVLSGRVSFQAIVVRNYSWSQLNDGGVKKCPLNPICLVKFGHQTYGL